MSQSTTQSLTGIALQKFKKNFWGVFSLGVIVICGLLAFLAYALAPDNSENANQMHLSIHSKPPGFSIPILTVPGAAVSKQSVFSKLINGRKNTDTEIPLVDHNVLNNTLTYIPYSGEDIEGLPITLRFESEDAANAFAKTNIQTTTFHWGTDKYGRDLLSRMLVGARISFTIGFVAVLVSLLIGVFLGAIAGYYGGRVDTWIMFVINVTWSIPTLLLVIAITLALGKGFFQVFMAVGLTMWVEVARVVRGQVMGVKKMQYVTAARALGYTDFRIIGRHILPNIIAPLIVISAANFASAILIESGLSFLGIGAQPPMPSWGAMIKDHYSYIIYGQPYLALIPGIAIMVLVMAFMLMGNALRDALDVKR